MQCRESLDTGHVYALDLPYAAGAAKDLYLKTSYHPSISRAVKQQRKVDRDSLSRSSIVDIRICAIMILPITFHFFSFNQSI